MVKIVTLYAAAIAYSVVRYVAFTPANAPNLPVFIVNKAVAMSAAFCFVLAFWGQWRRLRRGSAGAGGGVEPATWFRAGIFGAVWHIPMSLAILTPAYFREFFAADAGRFSTSGEAVFLFGALTAGGIYLLTRQHWTSSQRWWLSLATVAALFCHTLFMGISRGLNMNAGHAYLPPMWLLSLIGAALGGAFLLMSRPRPGGAFDSPAPRPPS